MPSTTTKGDLPYPVGTDPNNVPADLQALAARLDAILGIETFTTADRDLLAAAKKWAGRVIYNSTTARLEYWDGDSWEPVSTVVQGVAINMADNYLTRPVLIDYAEEIATQAAATGAVTVDYTLGNVHDLTLTGNVTLTFANPPATGDVGTLTLIIRQDATGGRAVTWPASVRWAGGTTPTLTTAANKADVVSFITRDGGATWFGFLGGKSY